MSCHDLNIDTTARLCAAAFFRWCKVGCTAPKGISFYTTINFKETSPTYILVHKRVIFDGDHYWNGKFSSFTFHCASYMRHLNLACDDEDVLPSFAFCPPALAFQAFNFLPVCRCGRRASSSGSDVVSVMKEISPSRSTSYPSHPPYLSLQ